MVSAEEKLRQLAAANTTLQGDLGTTPFRWFDMQLAQGALQPSSPANTVGASCVRVLRVSTGRRYVQGNGYGVSNLSPLSEVRLQIDVLDFCAEVARQVAADVVAFLGTVDLASPAQFATPPATPPQFPSFLLSQRARMDYQLSKQPAYVQCLDVRLFNTET